MIKENQKKIIIIGAGGHANVLADLIEELNLKAYGVIDPKFKKKETKWKNINIFEEKKFTNQKKFSDYILVNGVGKILNSNRRKEIFISYKKKSFIFKTLIHPFSKVSRQSVISEGVQVMAGAVIQSGVEIGPNAIINTGVSVDHDCIIGKNSHISPGSIICGETKIGDDCFIGAGSVIVNNIEIKSGSVIKAGQIITKSI